MKKWTRNQKLILVGTILLPIVLFLLHIIFNNKKERPYIDIRPGTIAFSEWTEEEKSADPKITEECDKILLYFFIYNISNTPAYVDVSAKGVPKKEKQFSNKLVPTADWDTPYEHNTHLVIKGDAGRQPFTLALDKRAVDDFKEGVIKAVVSIKVKYNGINDSRQYYQEEKYIYSPLFEGQAKEIYSKGN